MGGSTSIMKDSCQSCRSKLINVTNYQLITYLSWYRVGISGYASTYLFQLAHTASMYENLTARTLLPLSRFLQNRWTLCCFTNKRNTSNRSSTYGKQQHEILVGALKYVLLWGTHAYTYTYRHTYRHAHTDTRTHRQTDTHTHIHTHRHTHTHIHTHTHTDTRTHTYTHRYTHTH